MKERVSISDAKTPMMKQYLAVKEDNPGALVMFRLGDFYEFFGEDAEIASRELDIVLTGRAAGTEERMPMCGVPHHALEQYLSRLVQKGYKVCICEQLEDPRLVKGLVKRGVVRIVTPGTAMEVGPAQEGSNYIASLLYGQEQGWGLAVCEVSTGLMRLAEFRGPEALEEVSAEICRLRPWEVLISENDYLLLDQESRQWLTEEKLPAALTVRKAETYDREKSLNRLKEQFSRQAAARPLWQECLLAGTAAAAILFYLDETQKAAPVQVQELELDMPGSCLVMDPTTFRNLEITRNLRTYEKQGSLLDLLDKTCTACGSRLLRQWLERPLLDRQAIEDRYDAVEIMSQAWSQRKALRTALKEIYDMERLMTRVIYRRAVPRELLALKGSFSRLPEIKELLGQLEPVREIRDILAELDDLTDLRQLLDRAISEDLPANWKEGGFIRDGYSAQADEYRLAARNGRQWMLDLEQKERERTGIKSLKIGFNKVFGYYLDITKANLSMVPQDYRRKQTLANGERFVTEELIRLEGLVLGSEEKMVALELSLYEELLDDLSAALSRIQATSRALARLDVFQALGEAAVQYRLVRPGLLASEENRFYFKELRHPVVETIMEQDRFVPNDLLMEKDTDLFIITGPNMGGKSTYCRSVALAFVMAQMGSFVPASEALLAIRDRVFARVGASDDLRGGQSTFMMEMNEVAHILKHATSRSLVILDEVGRGTGTFDGLSVAWAVSEYIISRIRAKTLFATHYLELTQLAELYPTVENLSLVVEEEGESIVFLHKILPGSANKSYGIHVARLAGLPEEVISRARAKLMELELDRDGENRAGKPAPDPPAASADSAAGKAGFTASATGEAGFGADEAETKPAPETRETAENEEPGTKEKEPAAEAREGQMSLFQPDTAAQNGSFGLSTAAQAVIRDLKRKNMMKLTPLDALNYLYRLKERLEEGKAE
ncbi:MAG: DNA mismatch repair protein MutS [Peptococcaceae bacterium]|nr:DNA mismatch repair protein MutS [Peptococcaceae bacterium]